MLVTTSGTLNYMQEEKHNKRNLKPGANTSTWKKSYK